LFTVTSKKRDRLASYTCTERWKRATEVSCAASTSSPVAPPKKSTSPFGMEIAAPIARCAGRTLSPAATSRPSTPAQLDMP
jgi:hypothetical protein